MVTQLMPPEPTQCPAGHPWVLRLEHSAGPPFWGCMEFPNCRHALAAQPMGMLMAELMNRQRPMGADT
eukprot:14508827-Alexandrium_andersonii.AAC.1